MKNKNPEEIIECPIRDVLNHIGDQWSLLILEALELKTSRFNELLREIDDISKQMLSKTLKKLEKDGFILRTTFAEIPPRVEYQLTKMGKTFMAPMKTMIIWADKNHNAIRNARKEYEKTQNEF